MVEMMDLELTLSPLVDTRKPLPRQRARPFALHPPAALQCSGGRTSGYMVRQILDAYEGRLPPDTHILFCNTGKEREETLEFVREMGEAWSIPIRWLEYVSRTTSANVPEGCTGHAVEFREVDFHTAARNGEPFDAVLRDHNALPNTFMRFCTTDMKIRVAWSFMWAQGYTGWQSAIGIRGDEPGRIARAYGKPDMPFEERLWPLYDAQIGEPEVLRFWEQHAFDLALAPGNSNCDACMLKGAAIRLNVFRKEPRRAQWWLDRQKRYGATWTKPGRATYDQLYQLAVNQPELSAPVEAEEDECFFCTD